MWSYPNALDLEWSKNLIVRGNFTVDKTAVFNGRVGIGTTDPQKMLHVGDVDGSIRIGGISGVNLYYTDSIGATNWDSLWDSAGSAFYFRTRVAGVTPVNALTILGTGNVGIGITNPDTILTTYAPTATLNAVNPIITSISPLVGTSSVGMYNYIDSTTPAGIGILFKTYKTNVGLIEAVKIDNAGNVGIGTTSPTDMLSVGTAGTTNGNILLSASGRGAGAGSNLTWNMNIDGGNANSILARIQPQSYIDVPANNELNFYVGSWNNNNDAGSPKMSILSSGYVGIGTTAPDHKFQVMVSGAAITEYGGYATKWLAGETVSGGEIVRLSPVSAGFIMKCGLADGYAQGQDMPIGAVYHTTPSTACNSPVWVVTTGRAKVKVDDAAVCSYGYFMRTSDTMSGAVLASQAPTVPSDASHWREVGHSAGSAVSGALVDCLLHFN